MNQSIIRYAGTLLITMMLVLGCTPPATAPAVHVPDGALTYQSRYASAALDDAYSIVISPDGKHVYVSAYTADTVVWFSRDLETGEILYGGRYLDTTVISGVYGIAISPDGKYVYANAYLSGRVVWLKRDAGSGALSYAGMTGTGTTGDDIAVSPDGKCVLVTVATAYDEQVVSFTRDAATGSLSGRTAYDVPRPVSVAISPDSADVYVASMVTNSERLYAFRLNSATGSLVANGMHSSKAKNVAISSDGKNVYSLGYNISTTYSSITCFGRNSSTGVLMTVGTLSSSTVPALTYCRAIALSPDGKNAYVTADYNHAAVWLTRDPVTGALTQGGAYMDACLDQPNDIAVSPDGKHVYVAAKNTDTVVWFLRDQ
jgi:DNA-binding beta-propeller fold protein YncE